MVVLGELNIDFIILIAFIVLMISVLLFSVFFNEKRKMLRFLKKLPRKRIGNFQINELVKVTGKVSEIATSFIAPLSKKHCVYYSFKIEEQKKRGKNNYWKTITKEEKIQDFFIEEKGDMVMILAEGKGVTSRNRIVLDKKKVVFSNVFDSSSDTVKVMLKEYGFDKKDINFSKNIRFSEEIIVVNQRITVVGNTTFKNLKEPIKRYSYSKIMSLESTKKQQLIITDIIT